MRRNRSLGGTVSPGTLGTLVALLLWSSAAQAAGTVGSDGAGPVRIGMTVAQADAALGEHFQRPDVPGADPTGRCFQVDAAELGGVVLMFIDGRLQRIDVDKPGLRTAHGVGVGDPEAAVRSAYGRRLRQATHAYEADGAYLTALDARGRRGVRFEINEGRVTAFHVGSAAAIARVEGCA